MRQLMFYLVFWFISAFNQLAYCGINEKRLLRHLFDPHRSDAHNILERPVKNDTDPLYVWFKVSLQQIIDVDEKNQILFANLWLDLTWVDYHFIWNPTKFGNITKIQIDPHKVWRPDILLYNSADEKFDATFATNVVITNDGTMSFIPPGMFKSTCKIDITWFPFDKQKCELKFGSWTYDGGALDLRFKCSNENLTTVESRINDPLNCTWDGEGDLSSYTPSGEWDLLGMKGKRTSVMYDCCAWPFIDLKYHIEIRRRTLYYCFNLIVPCVLISAMALLTFVLPPDAGEKISLGVTILLSLTMFLLLVADAMPQTSEALPLIGVTILLSLTVFLMMVAEAMPPTSDAVPVIGMYFACTMVMCSLSVVFTVIVLNYHHRDAESHPIPNWVRKLICTYLANILCMHNPKLDKKGADREANFQRRKRTSFRNAAAYREPGVELKERSSKSLLANILDLEDDIRTAVGTPSGPPAYANCVQVNGTATHNCSTKSDLTNVLAELKIITKKISEDQEDSDISSEWKFAARVVDRLCLIIFSLFTLISTCAILFSAPDVFAG